MLDPFYPQRMEINVMHPTSTNNADLSSGMSEVAGAAVEFTADDKSLHKNGLVTDALGNRFWYKDDLLHREDGPAVESIDGDKFWYRDGKFHREDGPAAEWANGTKFWQIYGKLHREDGPAIEYADGSKAWCLNDKRVTEQEFNKLTGNNKMRNGLVTDEYGVKYWYKDNLLHREDGPAIEWNEGGKVWYRDGECHREDGPALEHGNGDKFWYKNGKLHREGGPAIEWVDGDKRWYINGKLHREDGPAIEYADGSKVWCLNDKRVTEEEFNKNRIDAKTISSASGNQFDGLAVSVDDMEYLVLLAHYKDMDLNQMVGKLISDFVKTELKSMLKEKIDKRIAT